MRKAFSLLSVLFIFVLGFGVVGAQDVDPSGQTVVYWHQYQNESAQGNTIAAIIEEFNATNEWGITVEGSFQGGYSELAEQVNAGIISGELPNLVAGYANDAASYARDGVVVDLSTFINDAAWGLGENPDINQGLIDVNTTEDGFVLAFPNQSSAQVLAYNLDLLKELGFDGPATTAEEFKEQVCASANSTTADGQQRVGFALTTDASGFESWVVNAGGSVYHDGAFDFKSDAVINTLQMYQDLYNEGCGYVPAERYGEQVDFNLGLAPYYVTSSAGFTYVLNGFKDAGYTPEWGITIFPHVEGNEAINAFVPSIVLVESTPEQELASWLFLKHLATPEAALAWSSGSGYFNPVPSTAEALAEADLGFEGLAPYFNAANALINDENIAVYSSPALSAYSVVRGLVSTAIADVTSNGIDVATVAETLQAGADQALADSQS